MRFGRRKSEYRMWEAAVMQIANTLHRSPGSISAKAQWLRDKAC